MGHGRHGKRTKYTDYTLGLDFLSNHCSFLRNLVDSRHRDADLDGDHFCGAAHLADPLLHALEHPATDCGAAHHDHRGGCGRADHHGRAAAAARPIEHVGEPDHP